MDFPGLWQHFSIPARELTEEVFEKGLGFDGSSIRGWQAINESDMLVKPVADTAFVDPFLAAKTLVVICNICDPLTGEDYTRDPRNIARKAEAFLKGTGLADTPYLRPRVRVLHFRRHPLRPERARGLLPHRLRRGPMEHGTRGESQPRLQDPLQGRLLPRSARTTRLQDIRSEMMLTLESIDVPIEAQHHEVATGGQCEIDMRFNNLLTMADNVLKYKYIVKNTAKKHGKVATFMPKPLFGDNGSGMHVHMSFWKGGKNLFAGDGYAGLSQMALHAIGGLLKHAPSILAFATPTTNSFKRLVPGFEAPVNLAYSRRNRSASIRIPMYSTVAQGKAPGVPLPGPEQQPVPHLRRHAHGRGGRDPEQDRPGQAAGQGHLRPAARGAGRGAQDARDRSARCSRHWRTTTTTC